MNYFPFSPLDDAAQQVRKAYLLEFLKAEIISEEARQGILAFISNWNIRTGEYEGNVFVVHKLDRKNILVYADEQWGGWGEDETRSRLISRCVPIYTKDLVELIQAYCVPTSPNAGAAMSGTEQN